MARILVSAIIPTYNRANIICEAIDSVLGQTYPDIEIIVVDDGSNDNTSEILSAYGSRIKTIHQTNAGPSAARNKGIKAAGGEIIAFLDSDDLWMPTKIDKQVAVLKQTDKSVPCCICNAIFRSGNTVERSFQKSMLYPLYEEGLWLNVTKILSTRFVFFNQAVAIRREALDKTGMFDERLMFAEDYDLSMRMAHLEPWAYISEPLVVWRCGSANSLCEKARKNPMNYYGCIEKIHENVASNLSINSSYIRRHLKHRRATTKREIMAQKLFEKGNIGSLGIAGCLNLYNRLADAVLRRLPSYPQMEVLPLYNSEVGNEIEYV